MLNGLVPGSKEWLKVAKLPWKRNRAKHQAASYIKQVGSCQFIYDDDAVSSKSRADKQNVILVEGV